MGAAVAIVTVVVKTMSGKIGPVFPLKPEVIMGIVSAVAIMPVPGRIGVIGVPGVIVFSNGQTDLSACRLECQGSC